MSIFKIYHDVIINIVFALFEGSLGEYRRRRYRRWQPSPHPWSHVDHHPSLSNPRNWNWSGKLIQLNWNWFLLTELIWHLLPRKRITKVQRRNQPKMRCCFGASAKPPAILTFTFRIFQVFLSIPSVVHISNR